MSPNRLLIFKNQGSERLLRYFDIIAEKLAVDSQFTISGSCFSGLLRIVIAELKYYEVGGYLTDLYKFYRTSRRQLKSDIKTSHLIEEGAKASAIFSFLGKVSESLSVWLYYIIWIINAFNVKKILAGQGESLIIAPDEMYGFAAIVKFNSRASNTWIINTNSNDLFCNVLNFDSPQHYKYFSRSNPPILPIRVNDNLKLKVDSLFYSVFNNDIVHQDYTLAYSNEKNQHFIEQKKGKKNILVAAHIFKDAPNGHQFSFRNFENWLYEVLSALICHEDECHIFVKEHPSIGIYREEGVLAEVLNSFGIASHINFISADTTCNLDDFALIITCSGSICYEAAYLQVPVISCSRSFSSHLSNVVEASTGDLLRAKLETFFSNGVDDLFKIERSDDQYQLLAQHTFFGNICNLNVPLEDMRMTGTSGDSEVNLSEIADSFLSALKSYYSQRNQPGVTLLSSDRSMVEIHKCLK